MHSKPIFMKINFYSLLKGHSLSASDRTFLIDENSVTRIWETLISKKGFLIGVVTLLLFVQNGFAQPVLQSSTTNEGSSTTATVNKPSGVVSGDLMVVGLMVENGKSTAVTVPSGWIAIAATDNGNNVTIFSYYKLAGGSEPASYTFTLSTSRRWAIGNNRLTGAYSAGSPVADVKGANGSGTSVTAPSISPATSQSLVLCFYTNNQNATF